MKEKTYNVRITYEGTITCSAKDVEKFKETIWETHVVFENPYDNVLFDAEHYEIEVVEE